MNYSTALPGRSVIRDFIRQLRDRGDIAVVGREVNPEYELAAVTKCFQKTSEKALLFERVQGASMRVATNLYGSHSRLCDLIGSPYDRFCRHWNELVDGPGTSTPLQETVPVPSDRSSGSLSDLPMITYHGKDVGPYVTSALYLAKDPDSGVPNLSFHRSMHVSDDELRIRLGSTHDLAKYQARRRCLRACVSHNTGPLSDYRKTV